MLAAVLPSWSVSQGFGSRPAVAGLFFCAAQSPLQSSRGRSRGSQIACTLETGLRLPLDALTAAIESEAEQGDEQDLTAWGEAVELEELDTLQLGLLEVEGALEGHTSRLLSELGDIESAGLIFQDDGAPSPATLGIALVLTAERAAEVDFLLVADLVAASEGGANPAHASRARLALATAVEQTLAEMEAAQLFTDASTDARVSVNDGPQAQSMEEARRMHSRWAILELARARFAEDRPADWGSVGG